MRGARRIWAAYAAGLLVLVAGMGWVTGVALDLDRSRLEAQRRAEFEEDVRLALWRLDSRGTVLVGRETARPYDAYAAGDRAGSLLLRGRGEYVLLYFEVTPSGGITSPQVPPGSIPYHIAGAASGRQAEARRQPAAPFLRDVVRTALLAELRQGLDYVDLVEAIPAEQGDVVTLADAAHMGPDWTAPGRSQASKSQVEYRARAMQNVMGQAASNMQAQVALVPRPPVETRLEPMYPLWHGEHLLLARRAEADGRELFQGCVLDWPSVRGWLLDAVRDLLPEADLAPVSQGDESGAGRLLASLPVRLIPGPLPAAGAPGWTPIRLALLVAWACVLASVLSAGLLLGGAVNLGERRAAFVSAVTHELRTPLTTFRMYTEMLDEGMLSDDEARREYVGVLRREAERLSHLVENVLAFARLERGRHVARTEVVRAGALMQRLASELGRQAERCGATLIAEEPDAAADIEVRADASAVEQIMSNLIDNACKYACAEDDRVHLRAASDNRSVLLTVRDHGPGIARSEARRVFRPFRKSAHEAAATAPGVGLGLALSRQLARGMGGDLRLWNPGRPGACFVLSLLRADGPSG